ncbi:MAG TPA: hypothetical protein VG815_14225 [Chloroflexota bacterium]|nr:hypothetical protein [Chloroflexota bacterium]
MNIEASGETFEIYTRLEVLACMLKEFRTRWMYWRYRNITRNRQRMKAKWAMRRNRQPAYNSPAGRGVRPVRYSGTTRTARSWLALLVAVIGISILQHYEGGGDIVFLGDIAIIATTYFLWLQLYR